jgi:hypothetical protein
VALNPSLRKRMVPSGVGEGSRIDRITSAAFGNPLFGSRVPAADDKLGDTPLMSTAKHGWNYKDAAGALQHQAAVLKDPPTFHHSKNAAQVFETAALAVEGTQSGTYMGSVEWGWRIDGEGNFKKLDLRKVSDAVPSAGFMAAAKLWNKSTTAGTIKTTADPTTVYNDSYDESFTVEKGTTVVAGAGRSHDDVHYNVVTINSGNSVGRPGVIKTADMEDTGGGNATIPLPIAYAPPPAELIATQVPVYHDGHANYWYNGHWYYHAAGGAWTYYDDEPAPLRDHRLHHPPEYHRY